jgi:hypothetical protein
LTKSKICDILIFNSKRGDENMSEKVEFEIGDKCFIVGQFTHVFFISDFNENKTKGWIISNENGNPMGWVDVVDFHRGEHFGEELAPEYGKLLD